MKKIRLLAILLILCTALAACDTYGMWKRYPWYKADQWYCEEIDFEIVFPRGENDRLLPGPITPLEWDGKTYNVSIGFMAGTISFCIDEDGDGVVTGILEGRWKYEGKNMVVYDFEGSIFGDAFTELIFVPQ